MEEIVAIFDKKAGTYFAFQFVPNQHAYLRALVAAVEDPKSVLSKFPADFAAYRIGFIENPTGKLIPAQAPEFIVEIAQLVSQGKEG